MDNPPAFPGPATHDLDGNTHGFAGMSLRDYFAAAALQGYIASDHSVTEKKVISECAYEWADAMLAERDK